MVVDQLITELTSESNTAIYVLDIKVDRASPKQVSCFHPLESV